MLFQIALFHSFLNEYHSTAYTYHFLSICSSVNGHWGCFHVFAIVNSAAVNTGAYVSFWIMLFSGYMPRSGIAGSYGNPFLAFLRNLHTAFHSGYTNFHSHRQCERVPFFPSFHAFHTVSAFVIEFLIMAILTGVRCYLIVAVLSIFSCACWKSVCLLWKFRSSSNFFDWVIWFYVTELYVLFIYFGN